MLYFMHIYGSNAEKRNRQMDKDNRAVNEVAFLRSKGMRLSNNRETNDEVGIIGAFYGTDDTFECEFADVTEGFSFCFAF